MSEIQPASREARDSKVELRAFGFHCSLYVRDRRAVGKNDPSVSDNLKRRIPAIAQHLCYSGYRRERNARNDPFAKLSVQRHPVTYGAGSPARLETTAQINACVHSSVGERYYTDASSKIRCFIQRHIHAHVVALRDLRVPHMSGSN